MQRRLVHEALQRLPADLPRSAARGRARRGSGCPTRYAALLATHFPPADVALDALNAFATPAQQRLIFEEAFLLSDGRAARGGSRRRPSASRGSFAWTIASASRARAVLPFRLTPGQRQALKEIVDDLQRPQPMNRLLQGDVGAGKTIVALLAALVAMENGLQVAFMAPTEILAEQHFPNISRLLQPSRFRVGAADRRRRAAPRGASSSPRSSAGAVHLVVGTHALVQGDVRVHAARPGRHRRAAPVRRAAARDAAGEGAASRRARHDGHADPAHAGADASTAISTSRRSATCRPGACRSRRSAKPESRRDEVYAFVRERARRRAARPTSIYPLVEESAKIDLKAATEMADHLAQRGLSRRTASACCTAA